MTIVGSIASATTAAALAGMVVLLVEAAPLAQTPEPAQDDSIEALRIRANAGVANIYIRAQITYLPIFGFTSASQDFVDLPLALTMS